VADADGVEASIIRRVDWVALNFVVSVWALVGGVVVLLFVNSAEFIPFDDGLAPYGGRILAAMLGLVAVESLLWIHVYRNADREARWAAGLMGTYLAIKTAIAPLYGWLLVPFFGYASVSHLLFAARGRRR
jgi:hypothetical protein